MRPQAYIKNYSNHRVLRTDEIVFTGKSTSIGHLTPNGQLSNIHISNIIQTKQVLFRTTYEYIDIHLLYNNN